MYCKTYFKRIFVLALFMSIAAGGALGQQFEATTAPFRINFSSRQAGPVLVAEEESSTKVSRKYYALLIGVDEYQDPKIQSLSEPIKDANLLKDVLTRKYTFEESDVTLLTNPTFEDLNVAFERLIDKVKSEDLLLVFYAGHGWFEAIHPGDRDAVRASWAAACFESRPYEYRARLWHAREQQYHPCIIRATPIRNEDGSLREWVGACMEQHA